MGIAMAYCVLVLTIPKANCYISTVPRVILAYLSAAVLAAPSECAAHREAVELLRDTSSGCVEDTLVKRPCAFFLLWEGYAGQS